MDFLDIKNKTFLITGVANKKSVAYFSAKILEEAGANLIFTVQNEGLLEKTQKLFPQNEFFILDVEKTEDFKSLGKSLKEKEIFLDGILHSIAFANYSEGIKPFHETKWNDYAQASRISCFSLMELSGSLKEQLKDDASVVAMSISSTRATNYGYMGPIKASLDSAVAFLAKSFSLDSHVRFNAVCAGPLKTSASAGIPGYINNYLYAERLTMRHQALKTAEVANTIAFLLSPRSSGINASNMVVDAGMSANYFDEGAVNTYADHGL